MTIDELFDDGVANAGAIFRRGDQVIRPAGPHSPAVHSLLKHLEKVGFSGAPVAIALEDATETVVHAGLRSSASVRRLVLERRNA